MGDLIRPVFGVVSKPDDPMSSPKLDLAQQALHYFGNAAGYAVALVRDADQRGESVLHVVVGSINGAEAEAVATLPATTAGEVDADRVGRAVLRSFQMIEAAGRVP